MVQRYAPDDFEFLGPRDDGEYVKYEDYAKLGEALLECLGELASRLPTDKFVYRRLAEKHAKEVEDTVTLERLDALKRFQLLRCKAREVFSDEPS